MTTATTNQHSLTAIRSTSSASAWQTISHVASVPNVVASRPAGIPSSIGVDELYYWTRRWQVDEAESVRELTAGEGRTFSSSDEAIRWLLDPSAE